LANLKEFIEKEFLLNKQSDCRINVTGYGFDAYREEIKHFFSLFVENFEFHKEKNIKCIAKAIIYCKNKVNKDLFYTLEPQGIPQLKELKDGN
jgi:hypothetical protein